MFSDDPFFNNLWLDAIRLHKQPGEIHCQLDQLCSLGDIQKQKLRLFMMLWCAIQLLGLEDAFTLLSQIKTLDGLKSEVKENLRWIIRESAAPRKWLRFAENLYKQKCYNDALLIIELLVDHSRLMDNKHEKIKCLHNKYLIKVRNIQCQYTRAQQEYNQCRLIYTHMSSAKGLFFFDQWCWRNNRTSVSEGLSEHSRYGFAR